MGPPSVVEDEAPVFEYVVLSQHSTNAEAAASSSISPECPDGYEPIENKVQEISIGIQTDPAPEYDASVVDIAMSLEDRITEIFHNAAAEDARIVMDSVAAAAAAAATAATPLPAPEEVKAEVEVEAEVEVKAEEEKMVWS